MEIVSDDKSEQKDPVLWNIAKKRYGFKWNLASYIIVNSFLWILYFMTLEPGERDMLPWPIWPTFGWGIGLAFNYVSAYAIVKSRGIEKEYQKLVNEDRK